MNIEERTKKKAWQRDRTPDLVSSEQDCGLVEQTSVSNPRDRMFDSAVMLLFFLVLSSIHFVCFLLFVLFCFIYNIYRITYLREIIFPYTTHNERSFLLFQYLTNYLSLKLRTNENNVWRGALLWTERASTFFLRSHWDAFAFFIALARLSDQKINDVSSTTWTKQNKKHFFSEQLSRLDPICIYILEMLVLSTVSDDC